MLALQAQVGMGESQDGRRLGEFTVADLIPEALRQNLSRLIVGEVRGGEAGAMFEAMKAGAGTLSTTHSHSAASTMDRLASRVAQGGVLTVEEALPPDRPPHPPADPRPAGGRHLAGRPSHPAVAEIRQLTGAIESGRPVTHLCYAVTATTPGPFHPDAGLRRRTGGVRRGLGPAMTALVASLGVLVAAGIVLIVAGLLDPPTPRSRTRSGGSGRVVPMLRRHGVQLVLGLVGGVALPRSPADRWSSSCRCCRRAPDAALCTVQPRPRPA